MARRNPPTSRSPRPLPPAPGHSGLTWCDEDKHELCPGPPKVPCHCDHHGTKAVEPKRYDPDRREWV